MSDDHAHLIDASRSSFLGGVGAPGYRAVTAVAADGSEHLVLAECASLGEGGSRYEADCPDVQHEQLGPLPDRYRLGLQCVPHRCGRPTKSTGRRCRLEVGHPGAACSFHRTRATA